MRKLCVLILAIMTGLSHAQSYATDFTASDCNGNVHHLFDDLDAGKAVVIVWVMPCAPCIAGALTAQTEVQTALQSDPGKVVYFLADDYANTSCNTLKNWCNTNGITLPSVFSTGKISMSDYGEDGMPKVVVIGGSSHKVFYNEKAPNITAAGIRNGIAAAIAEGKSGSTAFVSETGKGTQYRLYPNPAMDCATLEVNSAVSTRMRVALKNSAGQEVKEVYDGSVTKGLQTITINTSGLEAGLYYLVMSDGKVQHKERLVVY